MNRVTVRVQGDALAQGVFDVLNGRNLIWTERKRGERYHLIAFDWNGSNVEALAHVRLLFPFKPIYLVK
jgi:hypothetical protein